MCTVERDTECVYRKIQMDGKGSAPREGLYPSDRKEREREREKERKTERET